MYDNATLEADVEATEFGSDDEEHTEGFCGVFDLGKEIWCQTEGECDLGGLVEVCLQYGPIFFGVIYLREGERGGEGYDISKDSNLNQGNKTILLVEDQQTLKDLLCMLVRHSPPNLIPKILIRQRSFHLQSLIRNSRYKRLCLTVRIRVMCHSKVHI